MTKSTDGERPDMARSSTILMATGFSVAGLGALAWIVLGEWRWFVGALVVFLVLGAVDAATRPKR
jgi:hypothetical protein